MIRNELERRNARKQLDYLRSELAKREDVGGQDEAARGVGAALRALISDVERQLAEYEDLKSGRVPVLDGDLDGLGKLLIRARIARGWRQADLAGELDMEPQQVQRYERDDWQRAGLWRLQEAAEALELDVEVRASLGSPAQTRSVPAP